MGSTVWTFRTGACIVPTMTAANAPVGTAAEPWFVIDSDAENANAGYDRDSIPASAQVIFNLPVGVDSSTESYRVAARLLDPAGVAVPLANANSGATTLASAAQLVELTQIAAPTWTRTYLLTTADDTTERRFKVAVPYVAARYDRPATLAAFQWQSALRRGGHRTEHRIQRDL